MREYFEARDWDGAGRVGRLSVPRAGVTVETPALLPVVNPNIQTLEPRRMQTEFGAQILITNSYIIKTSDGLRERALDDGLHDLLDFDGAIMTDSGSFQLAEYGEIDVTTAEILQFQYDIGSDIGTPVDIPTPPDAAHADATADLERTQERLSVAADVDVGDMLVNAPVQGSTHLDLREAAGRYAAGTDLDVFPVGAVVPLMNAYRYGDMVDVVAAAKRGLAQDCPVHLFGAGHPMMFALAAAMGCDLFDSAAYALYARDDRYLTVRGTRHLEDLEHLPCPCPVCTERTPRELRALGAHERGDELAAHNLHVSFAEMRRVRQAIRTGSLLELVEARARAHPAMLDGYRAALEHAAELERTDAASKDTFFYLSAESARRPEVRRHHERLERVTPRVEPAVDASTEPESTESPRSILLTEGENDDAYDASWPVEPPFGPFPRDLRSTYPLTAELPDRLDSAAYEAAADGIAALVDATAAAGNEGTDDAGSDELGAPDSDLAGVSFTLAHRDWPDAALSRVPDSVNRINIHGRTGED